MINEILSNEEVRNNLALLVNVVILAVIGVITKWVHGVKKDTKEVNKTVNGRDTTLRNDLDAQGRQIDVINSKVDTMAIAVVKLNNKLDTVISLQIDKENRND